MVNSRNQHIQDECQEQQKFNCHDRLVPQLIKYKICRPQWSCIQFKPSCSMGVGNCLNRQHHKEWHCDPFADVCFGDFLLKYIKEIWVWVFESQGALAEGNQSDVQILAGIARAWIFLSDTCCCLAACCDVKQSAVLLPGVTFLPMPLMKMNCVELEDQQEH